MSTARLAWEYDTDEDRGQRVLAYEPDMASEIDGEDDMDVGELNTADLRRMTAAFTPIFDFLLHSGQRNGKPSEARNPLSVIGQRVLVMAHVTSPRASSFKNFAEMAREWGVSRTVVGRHVRDWNAAFGIFGSSQKIRSAYEQDDSPVVRSKKYSEAAKRSHRTRKLRGLVKSP